MEKVIVGRIVNTHGIKGEVRILSDFEYKEKCFKIDNYLIINNNKYKIKNYRVHKDFDMITFYEFDNINQVLPFKGLKVYVNRESLDLKEDEYLLSDLIGMKIILNDQVLGIVNDYTNDLNPLIEVDNNGKIYYIPIKGDFIKSIDINNNKIIVMENIKELIL